MKCQKRGLSQCLFRFFSVICLLSNASFAVHGGLWNGVDWMVGFVYFSFLTPVTELIGVVRTEVAIAPNVELKGKTETDFIDHNETNNHKKRLCSQLL